VCSRMKSSVKSDLVQTGYRNRKLLVSILFLLSGACGLIYEVLWCRELGLVLGNTSYSISAVLTAFMLGLALGSFIAGRNSNKFTNPLFVYGIIEILIGLYCALLPFVWSESGPLRSIYESAYGETGNTSIQILRFISSLLLLLIPTSLMGATLPILSSIVVTDKRQLGQEVGTLYAINSLGAVIGTLMTGFLLLPYLGKSKTNLIAVICNISIGLLAIFFSNLTRKQKAKDKTKEQVNNEQPIPRRILYTAITTLFLTGTGAMITQIGWTRAISLSIGSSTYAFSLTVAIFILGLTLGAITSARLYEKYSGGQTKLLSFLLMLAGTTCLIVTVILGFGPLLSLHLFALGTNLSWTGLLALKALGIALLLLVPTFLMGTIFPLILQAISNNISNVPREVGKLYASNTIGSVTGCLLGGLVLLPILQIQSSLYLAALLYLASGLIVFYATTNYRQERIKLYTLAPLAISALIIILAPSYNKLLLSSGTYLVRNADRLNKLSSLNMKDLLSIVTKDQELLFYKEGLEGSVAVVKHDRGVSLRVGGKPDASSNADLKTQVSLSFIPAILHAEPKEVLVVGLGSGVSAGCVVAFDTIKRVDVVELSKEVVEASSHFSEYSGLSYKDRFPWINTPNLDLIINDGRNHLALTNRKYDVIASEPSNPWMAGQANLFTKEAFELARNRLNPGGIMSQWIHGYDMAPDQFYSIVAAFGEAFPYMQLWNVSLGDYLLIGSEKEIKVKVEDLNNKFKKTGINNYVKKVGLNNIEDFLSNLRAEDEVLRFHSRKFPIHTDDNLFLEFTAPRAMYMRDEFFSDIDFIAIPDGILDFSSMPKDELSDFLRKLDLAVQSYEHSLYRYNRIGPANEHYKMTLLLSGHSWKDIANYDTDQVDQKEVSFEINRAKSLIEKKKYVEALNAFRMRLALDPLNPESLKDVSSTIQLIIDAMPEKSKYTLPLYKYLRRIAHVSVTLYPDMDYGWQGLSTAYHGLKETDPQYAGFYEKEANKIDASKQKRSQPG
jgi:spermidine synthase